jgi:hypothetical protein
MQSYSRQNKVLAKPDMITASCIIPWAKGFQFICWQAAYNTQAALYVSTEKRGRIEMD